jgi:hypothetical protein
MTSEENIMKVEYFCPECGGTNVRLMCMWDTETQQWERTDPDDGWCDDCDEELRKNLGKRTSMRGGKVRLMQEIKSE